MLLKEDTSPVASLAESLLISISKITVSVECIEIEQDNFTEIGSYLYRASLAIMELQRTENSPENAVEILLSLSKSIDLAKNLVWICQKGTQLISDLELRSIITQFEGVIKDIGECLSLIPSSTYGDQEYAEVAVRSLSTEMKNVHFKVSRTQILEPKELEPQILSLKEQPVEEPAPTEKDLYPISFEFSVEIPQKLDMPNLHPNEFQSTSNRSQRNHGNRSTGSLITSPQVAQFIEHPYETLSLTTLPQAAQFMEPLYDTFFCPLTKKIMEDPVTIATGVTYEKNAITEWFDKFESSKEIYCPTTGKKLLSRELSTNIALKTTIEKWKERNEAARIKVARAALSLASSESMILEALQDLQSICQRKQYDKVQIRNIGIIQLLIKFLEYKDGLVRCATLEILRKLAEEDDESKEIIVKTMNLSTIIKMLSSNHQPLRHASLLFLLELSKSQSLCETIASVTGGILMLITVKYNQSFDAFTSEKADEILKNLERSPNNIKCMAENGLLEPLLNHLIEGSEEMKIEMGSYLGEIVLGHDSKTYVARRASPTLIKMVQSGNNITRKAAFKALEHISSYHPNGKTLVEAGTVQVMVEEMFTRRIYNEQMNSKKEAAGNTCKHT
ncbi:hypothetical protein L1049_007046 [Liquidambar formosana]|uniref:RING-type E3 ubiquitin transferase n=1 Tax=Liquidambar formosana TaxID=63359 RepID=A0AAP0RHY9_LIQFO